MPIEGQPVPKLKEFKYRLAISGYLAAYVQSFDPGDRKHGIIKTYGGGMNYAHKETGMIEYEDAVLTGVVPTTTENEFWGKTMNKAQDPGIGRGQTDDYPFMMTLTEMDNQDNPVRTWDFFNCQVSNYKLGKREAGSLDKPVIEEIHIAYDHRRPA